MKQIVFGDSVRGSSHKRANMECQDSFKKVELNDGTVIMTVADGHGSKSCPFSKSGSKIAVNVFCKVMQMFYDSYKDNLEMLLTYLNREGDTKIAQTVDAEWKRHVLKVHANNKRDVPYSREGEKDKAEIYKLYGTTLLGLMITPIFLFAFQLGDGDISCVNNYGFSQVLQADKILGTETHSLSKIDSWKRAISLVRRRDATEELPLVYIMSTDGFSNSYGSEQEFQKTCTEYFEMINHHGADAVAENLKDWLSETSEMGCGDDITLVITYFCSEDVPAEKDNSPKTLTLPPESEWVDNE